MMTNVDFSKCPTGQSVSISMAKVEQDIEYLKKGHDEMKDDVKRILDKFDSLDNKFANKWVEKLTIGTAIGVISGIMLALVTLL